MSRAIVEEEFNEWLQHPVTKALREVLEAKREELRQQWEGGAFGDYTKEATILVNVGNVGFCRGLAFASEMTYEVYLSEIDDGKQIGPQGPGESSAD